MPVELKQLVSASTTFAALINEVAKEYTGRGGSVRWVVEVAPGSVKLPVRAEPASDEVAPSAVHAIPHWIADGLAQLSGNRRGPITSATKRWKKPKASRTWPRTTFRSR